MELRFAAPRAGAKRVRGYGGRTGNDYDGGSSGDEYGADVNAGGGGGGGGGDYYDDAGRVFFADSATSRAAAASARIEATAARTRERIAAAVARLRPWRADAAAPPVRPWAWRADDVAAAAGVKPPPAGPLRLCRWGAACRAVGCGFAHAAAPGAAAPRAIPCRWADACRARECPFLHGGEADDFFYEDDAARDDGFFFEDDAARDERFVLGMLAAARRTKAARAGAGVRAAYFVRLIRRAAAGLFPVDADYAAARVVGAIARIYARAPGRVAVRADERGHATYRLA